MSNYSGGASHQTPKMTYFKNKKVEDDKDDLLDKHMNYKEYVEESSLEPSIYKSHNKFIDGVQHRTTGASVETILGGDVDINPWVGLRRPNYYSTTAGSSSRVVHSEIPDQMSKPYTRRLLSSPGTGY